MNEAIGDERLRGSVPSPADRQELETLLGDPRVGATLGGVRSPEQVAALVARWSGLWTARGLGPWLFRAAPERVFVGYAGLAPCDDVEPGAWELLYGLRPEHWGRGLATRMGALALAHAFAGERAPRREVIGFTLTTNAASRRVLEKLGFAFEREFQRAGLPHVLLRLPAERRGRRRADPW